ncbi:NADPH-dependent FMN reductase [Halobacteriovorax sp. GFR7]|uniref:NADPH-dependent FMN reductase n=1 Tax=unclassified Halobacteriovorax TaxID=2639665 RepID=UPI00371EB2DD
MSDFLIVTSSDGMNLKMADKILELAQETGRSFEIVKISDYKLPLYTAEEEKNGIPEDGVKLTEKFIAAKGFVFLTPEYNGSVTPSFINAIAWVSRSGGESWREAFVDKPAVLGTHSGGGGQYVIQAMQNQLSFIGLHIVGRKLLTNYSKQLNEEGAKGALASLVKLA